MSTKQSEEPLTPKYSHVPIESSTQSTVPRDSSPTTCRGKIENFFKLRQRGSTWGTEIRAGCVTFVTMAYILAVNADIIAQTGGPCTLPSEGAEEDDFFKCQEIVRLDLITATAVGSLIACFMMGLSANMPIGMAPGMGINAYFTFSVVGQYQEPKVKYEVALFAVFLEGWIFMLLTFFNLRTQIAAAIPEHLKSAITAGIGMFLALIGLQADEGMALVVSDPATNLALGGCGHVKGEELICNFYDTGDCGCPDGDTLTGATTWLGIIGFLLMTVCVINKVKGGIMVGIFFVSFVSWFRGTKVTYFPDTIDGDRKFEYFKQIFHWHSIELTGGCLFDWTAEDWSWDVFVALLTMLYVDILDTTGTLYSMAMFCGLMREKEDEYSGCCACYKTTCQGYHKRVDNMYKSCCACCKVEEVDFPRSTEAFCSDAIGTIVGSTLGTTDVTAYIESASGINEGGKTGITACVVGILFFISLFFSPIFASIPPWATGPALVLIGAFMMETVTEIDWRNYRQSVPAFLTIIMMPFTYSIAYGIIAGLFVHLVIWITDKLFDCCCASIPGLRKFNAKRYDMDDMPQIGSPHRVGEEEDVHDDVNVELGVVDEYD
eukprot:111577_1